MKPGLLQFEGEYGKKINIVKVDVRNQGSKEYKEYIKLFDSKYVPHTIVIDKNQKLLNKHTGTMTKDDLVKIVTPFMK